MKPITRLLAAIAVSITPAPVQAQVYQQAQAGALAYCSARAAGKTHEQANRAFTNATVDVAGFGSLFNSRAVNEQGGFLARQMCPEYFAQPQPADASGYRPMFSDKERARLIQSLSPGRVPAGAEPSPEVP